ncbi:UNVERIFIED_CONTAM: hypothetical protein Sangu_1625700 [Sesamum angustifolium]|uniref:CCDC93 coiled-coil domain-containing protein n=1 Tax=Sesamum angustifolium TaxID=2727405 RepID=A0AAW2MHM1_9LAMI
MMKKALLSLITINQALMRDWNQQRRYELRFSELNTQIQKKLRQTRKHYDTYNALLEIKELMLKETSLLNSISLQKLEKVQLTLQSEQKLCDTVKDKHAAAISEQRQSSSLLKLFQEECARNERLQAQVHGKTPCT